MQRWPAATNHLHEIGGIGSGPSNRDVLTDLSSQDIPPEESSRGNDAHSRRVKEMNKDIKAVRQQIQSAESRARRTSAARRAELAVKVFELR